MILGVDHLALTATDLDEVHNHLLHRGFECSFVAHEVPNHPSKAHLLGNYRPTHDLGYYRPPTGIPIEVTVHGDEPVGRSPFSWAPDRVTLNSSDPTADTGFIRTALRFRNRNGLLSLVSPIPAWNCTVEVCSSDAAEPILLDAPGYPCLALLTNAIEDDLVRAITAGAIDTTDVFFTTLPDKVVRTVLFRSPADTIFELVEINRGSHR
jgi:hypothetical protein